MTYDPRGSSNISSKDFPLSFAADVLVVFVVVVFFFSFFSLGLAGVEASANMSSARDRITFLLTFFTLLILLNAPKDLVFKKRVGGGGGEGVLKEPEMFFSFLVLSFFFFYS